jgi:hypothetical protein
MTSRKLWRGQVDRQMDALIKAALRERVAEREPSSAAWEAVARKCTYGRSRAISGVRQRILSAWVSGMRWTFPLFEAPAARPSDAYVSGHNVHWAWLDYHRVNVRLAC